MDVNQIFKELGTMIHSQGEVVNSIESSVEYATVNVESGTQELREAANYKVMHVIHVYWRMSFSEDWENEYLYFLITHFLFT